MKNAIYFYLYLDKKKKKENTFAKESNQKLESRILIPQKTKDIFLFFSSITQGGLGHPELLAHAGDPNRGWS